MQIDRQNVINSSLTLLSPPTDDCTASDNAGMTSDAATGGIVSDTAVPDAIAFGNGGTFTKFFPLLKILSQHFIIAKSAL